MEFKSRLIVRRASFFRSAILTSVFGGRGTYVRAPLTIWQLTSPRWRRCCPGCVEAICVSRDRLPPRPRRLATLIPETGAARTGLLDAVLAGAMPASAVPVAATCAACCLRRTLRRTRCTLLRRAPY